MLYSGFYNTLHFVALNVLLYNLNTMYLNYIFMNKDMIKCNYTLVSHQNVSHNQSLNRSRVKEG